MKKFALVILAGASVAFLSLATAPQEADAGNPCARKTFKTKYVEKACKTDQKTAVKAMKDFLSKAKKTNAAIKNCKSCHSGLKKDGYPLNDKGLDLFNKAFAQVKGQLKLQI
ncbi:MAG: hypothetical protein MJE77_33770 [Proteobacteria bacterium]|nr:hypothetical protein [Pseudomonadota bacterium]